MLTDRSASDSQLSDLDGAATLALCKTLADYGEAGALSHDLMLRAGRYATSRFADNLEILLAAARMYQLGGELEQARKVLIRAGKLAPEEARTLRQLGGVLRELGLPVTPALAIAEAEDEPERPAPRAPSHSGEIERRARPSQQPTRQMPAQKSDPDLAAIIAQEKIDAEAIAAMGRAPLRRISSATQRAVVAAVNTPTMPTLRSQMRSDPNYVEPPRASGALRAPEGRGHSGIRSNEGSRSEESEQPAEAPRPARSSRIKLLDPNDPTRQLDRYELIGEIASGGMATVFLARRDGAGGFQRMVAIKRLHPHLAHQEEFVEMFLDEARLAAAIHHPHVVPILESENGHYVVMEFIEGDTLAGLSAHALARGEMLPRAVAVRIVLDALAGLHAAHQLKDGEGRLLGLVHRDCTPQNILVGADGSSRLTDFGVARASSRLAITRSQTVKGKVAYLSPEQATAEELDRRSDIFTMGIVLWEVLAGRPLFLADNDATTISRLLSGPIPSVRQYAPDVSPELDEVCVRALQRNVARRYPTAAAMAEALEVAARNGASGAGSPGEVGRCVEMLIGADLAAQRDALRVWMAQNESTPESRRRTSNSDTPGGRLAPVVEIPRPPALPQLGLDAALPAAESSSDRAPAEAPIAPRASSPPPPIVAPATIAANATISAPTPPRAPLSADAKKRRRTVITVAAILVVGASSPLWMKRALDLRDKLWAPEKAPAGAPTTRPRTRPSAAATATAGAPAAPPDPALGD